jgi:hypothetical protein
LYPWVPELLKQVEELEALFNTLLGTATPIWEYSYTFHNPKLAKRRFTYGVPFHEHALFPLIFPLVSSTIRRQIKEKTEAVTNAHAQIIQIFEAVGNLVADERTCRGNNPARIPPQSFYWVYFWTISWLKQQNYIVW